jgi:hypothetical protein
MMNKVCECKSDYIEVSGDCVLKVNCNDGQYRDASNKCQLCQPSCLNCKLDAGKVECSKCKTEFDLANSSCNCKALTYYKSDRDLCVTIPIVQDGQFVMTTKSADGSVTTKEAKSCGLNCATCVNT